jgi:catechol 2,3-dioxygenase-like lactoylglutathione lyase family enzyme
MKLFLFSPNLDSSLKGELWSRENGLVVLRDWDQQVEIAMMVTPDGHSRLELSRFITPAVVADHRNAPVNALGYLRAMFTVSDIDETLERLQKHGAELVGEVVQYENSYRLCYIRGPEGLLIGLAEELEEEGQLNTYIRRKALATGEGNSSMTNWLVKRKLAKSESQANIILLCFSIVMFIFSALILISMSPAGSSFLLKKYKLPVPPINDQVAPK